jgi:hypothetical protein
LFEAPTVEETLRQVCTATILPPSTAGLRPPPSLDFVCMKALERDPNRRFRTAEEMMELLRRIALREELLASHAKVAAWVKNLVGPELTQRRLVVLDLSRRGGGETSPPPPVAAARQPSIPPGGEQAAQPLEPISSHPPAGDDPALSQTIVLDMTRKRPWPLIAAAALAALMVLVTLLWPNLVSKIFRINTEGAFEQPLDLNRTPPPPASKP